MNTNSKLQKKYLYITNPKTTKKVRLSGKTGQTVLLTYLNKFKHIYQKGGGDAAAMAGEGGVTTPPITTEPNNCPSTCTSEALNPTSSTINSTGNSLVDTAAAALQSTNTSINNQAACTNK